MAEHHARVHPVSLEYRGQVAYPVLDAERERHVPAVHVAVDDHGRIPSSGGVTTPSSSDDGTPRPASRASADRISAP